MGADRSIEIGEPLIKGLAFLCLATKRADQSIRRNIKAGSVGEGAGKFGRLIVFAPKHASPVRGDGHNEHVGREDWCNCLGEPPRGWSRNIRSVGVFEREYQLATVARIDQRGATMRPGTRNGEAFVAVINASVVLTGKRRTTEITNVPHNKARLAPTGSAESVIAFHHLTTTCALRRVNRMDQRLHFMNLLLWSRAMTQRLTDPSRLALTRARSTASGMFLQEEAAFEIQDRLTEVNKAFTKPAIVTGFPSVWSRFFPDAKVVEDTETLDLTPGSHDLVIHGLSLHWANDPVGQLIQCYRALEPDGLFLGAMFGGETLNELREVLSETEIALTGGLSPRLLPMGEIRDLGALLQRAGFALPVADGSTRNATYSDALALLKDLREMGEGNALSRRSSRTPRSLFPAMAARYAEQFGAEDGRIPATFEMIFLAGWAPHESQQKPLRPGSAQMRLADALKTDETKLDDKP